jgi:hypothetical protein
MVLGAGLGSCPARRTVNARGSVLPCDRIALPGQNPPPTDLTAISGAYQDSEWENICPKVALAWAV